MKDRVGVVEITSKLQEVLRVLDEASDQEGQPLTLKLQQGHPRWVTNQRERDEKEGMQDLDKLGATFLKIDPVLGRVSSQEGLQVHGSLLGGGAAVFRNERNGETNVGTHSKQLTDPYLSPFSTARN